LGHLGEDKYSGYIEDAASRTEDAASGLLKIFLNLVGVFILLVSGRVIRSFPKARIYVNFILMGIMIYNTFLTFQPAMRLYWYLYIYLIIFVPMILTVFTARSRTAVIGILLVAFGLFSLKMYKDREMDYGFDMAVFDQRDHLEPVVF
jgi:hypothetical protein